MRNAQRNSQCKLRGARFGRRALLLAAAVTVAGIAQPTFAKGKGNNVVVDRVANGTAAFSSRGNQMIIRASDRAIINYKRFDIPKGAAVRFIQPSATSRLLNRINSERPSIINGKLNANGIVYFVNPAGFVFGEGSIVNATQIFAAAGSLTDANFLAGVDHFENLQGRVINFGSIEADSVTFVGELVANHGTIVGGDGVVTLASGNDVLIGREDGHIFVRVDQAAAGAPAPGSAPDVKGPPRPISNGLGAGDVYSIAVRNSGHIKARQVQIDAGNGVAAISGKIDVSAKAPGATGGRVEILGDKVLLAKADIKASGHSGGGTVLVGGDVQGTGSTPTSDFVYISGGSRISADALATGNGGKIVVFANDSTRIAGQLRARGGAQSGNGGFIETSGKQFINVATTPDVTAQNGTAGQWLIDPFNITIVPGGANTGINAAHPFESTADDAQLGVDLITAALNGGATVTITTGASATAELGDITLTTPLDFNGTGAGTLSLIAHNNININGQIFDSDTGTADSLNLTLTANSDAAGGGAVSISQPVSLGTGAFTASGASISLGNNVTSGNQTYNAPVTLAAATVSLNAGAGNVVFANTLALADNDLTITAAEIDFNGGANSVSGGGGASNLLLQPNAAGTAINVGNAAPGADFDITDTDIAALADGLASLTIGRADGSHNVEIESATFIDPVTIQAPSTGVIHVAADGAVDGLIGADNASITLDAQQIQLEDNVTTNNSAITFDAPVVLQANTTVSAGTGAISFNAGAAGNFDLIVNSTGASTFGSAVLVGSFETNALGTSSFSGGVSVLTGDVLINDAATLTGNAGFSSDTGSVTFQSTLNLGGHALTVTAGEIDFNGGANSVSGGAGTSTVSLLPVVATTPINVGFAADAGAASLDITDTDLAALADNAALVAIGRLDGQHAIQVESATFRDPALVQSPLGGSITVVLDGAADGITGVGNASVTLTAPAITLNDNITTANSAQVFNGPIALGADVTLDAGSGAVTFNNGIIGANDLLVNSGGATTFNGIVDVDRLETNATGSTVINTASVETVSGQIHNDPVTLAVSTQLDAGAGPITFASTLDGAVALIANSTGTTTFGGAVGGTTPLATLTTNALGGTTINGGSIATTGAQTYNDPITLGANTTFDAGAAALSFNSTINGGFSLTANSTGTTTFGGIVGGTTPLNSILTNPGGATHLNGGTFTTTSGQIHQDNVVLGANTTINAGIGSAVFEGITGAFSLTINTNVGDNIFAGVVNIASLTTDAGGNTILGNSITTTGAQSFGDVVLVAADHTSTGSSISFADIVDGILPGTSLTANGATTFLAPVGSLVPLGALTVNGTTALNGGSVITTGNQTYNDAVTLGANTTLSAGTGNITFDDAVTGAAFSLAANSTGVTTFNGPVTVSSLTTNAGGSTVLNAGTVITSAGQTHNDAVTLGSATTLNAGAGDINFNSTLGGNFAVTANSTGTTHLGGAVNIGSLTTNALGTTNIAGGSVTTTGDQTYNDAVTLSAGAITLSGANVTFNSTVTGGTAALTVNASGATTFNDTVTVSSLTTDAAGTTALNGGTVTTSAGQVHNDPVTLGAAATLNAGAGAITFASTVTGPHALNANTTGATTFGGAVDVASVTTNAGGTTAINGGSVITTGNQIYNDAVALGAPTALTASAGNISLGSTLDLNGNDLTLTAVDIDITGPVTDGQGTSDVTIQPVSALVGINIGFTDADPTNMDISDTDLAALAAGLASLTIGRSNGQHPIEVSPSPSSTPSSSAPPPAASSTTRPSQPMASSAPAASPSRPPPSSWRTTSPPPTPTRPTTAPSPSRPTSSPPPEPAMSISKARSAATSMSPSTPPAAPPLTRP